MPASDRQLELLLDGVLDDSCTDAEREQLARLVEADPAMVQELVEQLRIHSLMQWQARTGGATPGPVPAAPVFTGADPTASSQEIASQDAISNETESLRASSLPTSAPSRNNLPPAIVPPGLSGDTPNGLEDDLPSPGGWHWPGLRWFGAFCALALFITGVVLLGGRNPDDVATAGSVAQIVGQQFVQWAEGSTALSDEKLVVPGWLKMKSGELTLQFRSGATVSATGEVAMLIESDMRVRLDRGQATANVPQWAKGFTIQTPEVEVIDLGTKFGVVARGTGSDVVVFEGKVDIKPTSSKNHAQKSLGQGEGVRVSNTGGMDRIYEVRHDSASGGWSTDELAAEQSVFKTIRDNVPSAEVPTYYQITHRGFGEDCQAYVDRHPHQWNGLTVEGLPSFLLGADYVRTCNDYRYINEFEMIVELARPADLYILYDDRVDPPAWLTEQFEDTGSDLGLDEGPAMPGTMHLSNSVGPGQSIDRVFSIWRRRCATAESVRLGAMGPQPGARAMYGIAAQPLYDRGPIQGPSTASD